MKTTKLLLLIVGVMLTAAGALGQVQVVTSTSDLAYFAREIGGNLISVEAIASPSADVHFVEARPSYMVKVKRADLVLKVGLELDMWMDQIIAGSRNDQLLVTDCSKHIKPLDVPDFKADARYGDLHRFGNPHYWLSPTNVKPITDAIVQGLSQVDPTHRDAYAASQLAFLKRLDDGLSALSGLIAQLRGVQIVTYHDSWPYFNEYVGLTPAGFIEPYPGVQPSPSHVLELVDIIKGHGVHVIGVEPYFDSRVPEKLAAETGARVVTLYPSVGGRSAGETYLQWFEGNLKALVEAMK